MRGSLSGGRWRESHLTRLSIAGCGSVSDALLFAPALDLARHVVARATELGEPNGYLVDRVQRRDDGIHRIEYRLAFGGSEPWQALVPENAAIEKFHEIEGAANDRIVFAQRVYAWHRDRCVGQRAHDPVFPVDSMGARQQVAEGLAP